MKIVELGANVRVQDLHLNAFRPDEVDDLRASVARALARVPESVPVPLPPHPDLALQRRGEGWFELRSLHHDKPAAVACFSAAWPRTTGGINEVLIEAEKLTGRSVDQIHDALTAALTDGEAVLIWVPVEHIPGISRQDLETALTALGLVLP